MDYTDRVQVSSAWITRSLRAQIYTENPIVEEIKALTVKRFMIELLPKLL